MYPTMVIAVVWVGGEEPDQLLRAVFFDLQGSAFLFDSLDIIFQLYTYKFEVLCCRASFVYCLVACLVRNYYS